MSSSPSRLPALDSRYGALSCFVTTLAIYDDRSKCVSNSSVSPTKHCTTFAFAKSLEYTMCHGRYTQIADASIQMS
ncbi:hypothetical protein BU25DRAFT_411519, partial [Macroventuria anomochaeta]